MWLWPNLLSLDAPLIAVFWMHLFAVCGEIHISPVVTLTLALVVWLIYVADRLFDGIRADPADQQSARHRFYGTHRNALLRCAMGGFAITCLLCPELDTRTLEFGTLLMLVVAAYFGAVHGRLAKHDLQFPKEAVVAGVFGVGTFFPVWIQARASGPTMTIILALFIVTCWLNLVLIEYAEWMGLRQCATRRPHTSTVIAGHYMPWLGSGTAIGAFLLSCSPRLTAAQPALLAISLSAVALAALGIARRNLSMNAVRVLADVALLSPGIVLLIVPR